MAFHRHPIRTVALLVAAAGQDDPGIFAVP